MSVRRRPERPVGRAADLVAALEADQHRLAPLGPEVDLVDLVDDDREVRGAPVGQAEVGGVVAPGVDRDIDADRRGEPGRPRAGDVDDDRGGEGPAIVSTPATASPSTRTADAAAALETRAPSRACRGEEAGRRAGRIGVAGAGLVDRGARRRRSRTPGTSFAGPRRRCSRCRPRCACCIATLARERWPPARPARAGRSPSGRSRSRRARRDPPNRGSTGTTPRRAALPLEVVVHPDEPRRPAGRASADASRSSDEHVGPALGEVEGEARALDAGADDDDLGAVDHGCCRLRAAVCVELAVPRTASRLSRRAGRGHRSAATLPWARRRTRS